MTYTQLWPLLVWKSLLAPKKTQPMKFPFAPGYNRYVKCDFHSGVAGHSIENYRVLQEMFRSCLTKNC